MTAFSWANLMGSTATYANVSSRDVYGARTGGSTVTFKCHIKTSRVEQANPDGSVIHYSGTLYMDGVYDVQKNAILTLPDGTQPKIKDVKTFYDEKGYNHIGFLGYNEIYGYKEIYVPDGYTLAGIPQPPLNGSTSAKTDANSLSYIPKTERTKEICIRALHSGKDLSYVPTKLRDEELCSLFYKKDKENYKFIPEEIRLKLGV
jgi:hypothetical protein